VGDALMPDDRGVVEDWVGQAEIYLKDTEIALEREDVELFERLARIAEISAQVAIARALEKISNVVEDDLLVKLNILGEAIDGVSEAIEVHD
jgi:hypothetical protein